MKRKLLGEILIEKGLLTQQQLDQALAVQAASADRGHFRLLGEVMIDMGLVSLQAVNEAVREQKGVPAPR